MIKEEGRRQRNDWFGEECKEVAQRRNRAYKETIRKRYTRKNFEEYKELRRQEKVVDKMKKKLFHENIMKEIEKLNFRNSAVRCYKLINDMREHFKRRFLHAYPPMKMEQTECSKTLAYKIQTPENYPEESIQHSEHGESLKSRILSEVYM